MEVKKEALIPDPTPDLNEVIYDAVVGMDEDDDPISTVSQNIRPTLQTRVTCIGISARQRCIPHHRADS